VIVVDTNIIAYLWLPNDRRPNARALLQRHGRWFAPILWRSEFRNVLAGYLRRGSLGVDDVERAYEGAAALLRGGERLPKAQSVLGLVATSDLSAYDCEFVSVADALQLPLATADRKILAAFPKTARTLEQLLR
jgi:predicted nucleic acid-binding protein